MSEFDKYCDNAYCEFISVFNKSGRSVNWKIKLQKEIIQIL